MSELRKLTECERRNIRMNVFSKKNDYMCGPQEICDALINPKKSNYDYFITFDSNAPSFTEGIKGLLEAAKIHEFEGFMWAVEEIMRQQKRIDSDATQIWHLSGFSGSMGTQLQGFFAVADSSFTADTENVIAKKVSYDNLIPEGVNITLRVDYIAGDGVLMLPSEYEDMEIYRAAA